MKLVQRLVDKLSVSLAYAAALMMLTILIHVMADVIGKYAFRYPIPMTLETVEFYYMVGLIFLPFAYVARGEGHICVELFTRHFSKRQVVLLDLFTGGLTLLYAGLITWRMGLAAIHATMIGEIAEAGGGTIVQWPTRWLPVLGTFVFSLTALARLVVDASRLVKGGDDEVTPDKERHLVS